MDIYNCISFATAVILLNLYWYLTFFVFYYTYTSDEWYLDIKCVHKICTAKTYIIEAEFAIEFVVCNLKHGN